MTKSKITKKNRGQILLMSLIDVQSLSEKFKVIKEKKEDLLELTLEPLEKDPSVQNLKLVLNLKSETIQGLSFQDDIGNKTSIFFQNIEFRNVKMTEKFEYSPTRNDEVTQI